MTATSKVRSESEARTGMGARELSALIVGCLYGLVALNGVQIGATFAGIDPSPAAEVLPFIAATLAIGLVTIPLAQAGYRLGAALGIVFALVSMIGMGPHKLFLEDGGVIAPVALVGFAIELALIYAAIRILRRPAGQ